MCSPLWSHEIAGADPRACCGRRSFLIEGAMSHLSRTAVALAALLTTACSTDERSPFADITAPAAQVQLSGFAAPSGIVTIAQGDAEASVWPYTSTGFSTTPQDPINLVFRSEERRVGKSVVLGGR